MCAPQSLTAASTGGDLAFRNKVTAGLIVRWNGTRWQVAPYPATPGDRLTSVAGTSAGHIWAAAWNEYLRHCRILRWDGRVWAPAGATLEAIAEDAGFSKGVMYSQFESKADLFLTLLERRMEERTEQNEPVVAGYAGEEGVRKLLEVGQEDWRTEAAWATVLVEFRALASRDPGLNARYAAAHAQTVGRLASGLELLYAKSGLQPVFPATVMAEFILALVSGITLERAANPAALPLEFVLRMVLPALGFTRSQESPSSAMPARAPHGAD
jgi:AcrR family transcriptional regulator